MEVLQEICNMANRKKICILSIQIQKLTLFGLKKKLLYPKQLNFLQNIIWNNMPHTKKYLEYPDLIKKINRVNKNVVATIQFKHWNQEKNPNTILCNENWQIKKMHNKNAQMSQDCPYMHIGPTMTSRIKSGFTKKIRSHFKERRESTPQILRFI